MFSLLIASSIVCSKLEVVRWPDGAINSSIECVQESRTATRRTLRQATIRPKSKPQQRRVQPIGNIPENFQIPASDR
jgi:hypothetical protein